MRSRLMALVFFVVLPVVVGATGHDAKEPKSILWAETGPFRHVDGTGPHMTSHQLLLDHRARSLPVSSSEPISQDVGDVAVIVDNGRIFIPPSPANPFDLAVPSGLRFDPGATTNSFTVTATTPPIDPSFGPNLGLSDDDAEPVEAADSGTFNGGAGFPYLGNSYTTNQIFVGSDGHITFGAPEASSAPRDAARHIGGPPRISPFFNDLDPSAAGSVHARVLSDRIVLTWNGLPEFGTDPATNSNTFQAVLWASGLIDVAYADLDAQFAVVGVAEGNDEGPIHEIDLSADLPVTLEAGAIFEEFHPAIVIKQMNVIEAAREFYRTHPDKYDFLVLFEDSVTDIGFGAFAFHLGVKNQTSGFGRGIFDNSALAGSAGELESILQMNRIGLYWPDENKMVDPPIKKFRFTASVPGATLDGPPGADQISRRARWFGTLNGDFGSFGSYTLGLNSAMSVMGQEAGHRWLAFARFQHPSDPNPFAQFDLLGRGFAHWSFFFNVRVPDAYFGGDPRASSAEGNAIVDLGPSAGACAVAGQTRFLTERNELIDGYTELDQYFMGLRLESEVSPFLYVDNPTRLNGTSLEFLRTAGAQDDRIFCGNRVDLTVADIQAVEGPRVPAIGDEDDTGTGLDVKTMAFILVVESDSPMAEAHAAAIQQVDIFRRTWEAYANGPATGGRGRFDTSLNPEIH